MAGVADIPTDRLKDYLAGGNHDTILRESLEKASNLIEEGCSALLGALDYLPQDLRGLLGLVYVMIGHVEEQISGAIEELTSEADLQRSDPTTLIE